MNMVLVGVTRVSTRVNVRVRVGAEVEILEIKRRHRSRVRSMVPKMASKVLPTYMVPIDFELGSTTVQLHLTLNAP